jgi:hypothetical protein
MFSHLLCLVQVLNALVGSIGPELQVDDNLRTTTMILFGELHAHHGLRGDAFVNFDKMFIKISRYLGPTGGAQWHSTIDSVCIGANRHPRLRSHPPGACFICLIIYMALI